MEFVLPTILLNLSIIKLVFYFQTVEFGLIVLPLIKPVMLDLLVLILYINSSLFTIIESNLSTLSIFQIALEIQVLTGQNVEKKKAIYNQKTFRLMKKIYTTNKISFLDFFIYY